MTGVIFGQNCWTIFKSDFCFFLLLVIFQKKWPAATPRYITSCLRAYEAHIWHVTDIMLHIICHQIGKCHTVQNKKIIFWHVKYNFDKVTLYWVSKNQTDRATNVSRGIWKYKRYSKFPKFPDLGAKLALLKVQFLTQWRSDHSKQWILVTSGV